MIEQIVAAAIMGSIDEETASDMIGLVTAVQTRIACKHGILDARTAVMWERKADQKVLAVGCAKCMDELHDGSMPQDVLDHYREIEGSDMPWSEAGIEAYARKGAE